MLLGIGLLFVLTMCLLGLSVLAWIAEWRLHLIVLILLILFIDVGCLIGLGV